MNSNIRQATPSDIKALAEIEQCCFPPAEAASLDSFRERLAVFGQHFWVLELDGQLIGFINGMVTNQPTITDEMFEHAHLHDEAGEWQTILGLDVLPAYRNQGYAARLMNHLIAEARLEKRKGCVLTCKEVLIHYYEKFGYRNEGVSASVHGGEVWYDMRLEF